MARLHQIFIGCPFRPSIRKRYDRLKEEIERETPLSVVLADTTSIRSTESLLRHITDRIRESAGCIFDVTGGNPNVSLEVGIAHALAVDFVLTLDTRRPGRAQASRGGRGKAVSAGAPASQSSDARAIISDLQGRNRIEYKTYAGLRESLRARYLARLPFLRRWHEFRRRNRAMEAQALQLLHEIRADGPVPQARVAALLDGSGVDARRFLDALSKAGLVARERGRKGTIGIADH
ncbi:MAG: hypothetical protein ACE15D_03555 [Candidatus Eisenbacteria bacterium]|nr:hypothetical protein [Candidatus Eisenbacteria bacterium]